MDSLRTASGKLWITRRLSSSQRILSIIRAASLSVPFLPQPPIRKLAQKPNFRFSRDLLCRTFASNSLRRDLQIYCSDNRGNAQKIRHKTKTDLSFKSRHSGDDCHLDYSCQNSFSSRSNRILQRRRRSESQHSV